MGLIKTAVTIAILAGAASYVTKPSEQSVDALLKERILMQVENGEITASNDPAVNIVLAGCKFDPDTCYDLMRKAITVTYTDRTFFAEVGVSGFGRAANCTAAVTRLFCREGA